MPELGTSGSVRGRDGQPPGLLDLRYYRKASYSDSIRGIDINDSTDSAGFEWV